MPKAMAQHPTIRESRQYRVQYSWGYAAYVRSFLGDSAILLGISEVQVRAAAEATVGASL